MPTAVAGDAALALHGSDTVYRAPSTPMATRARSSTRLHGVWERLVPPAAASPAQPRRRCARRWPPERARPGQAAVPRSFPECAAAADGSGDELVAAFGVMGDSCSRRVTSSCCSICCSTEWTRRLRSTRRASASPRAAGCRAMRRRARPTRRWRRHRRARGRNRARGGGGAARLRPRRRGERQRRGARSLGVARRSTCGARRPSRRRQARAATASGACCGPDRTAAATGWRWAVDLFAL